MLFPALTWILLLLSAAFAAVGFYKFSYFTTVGHALVTGGLGLCCLIVSLSRGKSSAVLWISVLLCLIYGLFQGGLAALEELLKTSRKKVLKSEAEENTPLYVSICFWLAATLAGFFQISPLWYRVSAGLGKDSILSWLGLFLMLGGVAVILLALRQAHGQRQKDPSLPPMEGLYNWVRCPGQLGRLLFATGLFLSGVGYLSGLQWLIALLGYASALYLALSSAFRQDRQKRKKYGYLPEYREYVEDTHILMPLMMSRKIDWDE